MIMGCFCSSHSSTEDLRNHSLSHSSIHREAFGEDPSCEQHIGHFNVDNIEYADHGHSDSSNDRYDGRWNESKEIEIDTGWSGGGDASQEYENEQDF